MTFRIPKSVDAPGGRVNVVYRAFPAEPRQCGEYEELTRTLSINPAMPHEQQVATYFHELTHVALSDAGVDELLKKRLLEAICDAVATARIRESYRQDARGRR